MFDNVAFLRRIRLDRFVRVFLFPLSVILAIAALVLAVETYSDLRHSSISSAFVTVQAVQEAYTQEREYPDAVVLASFDRKIERFWVVSENGDILAASDEGLVGQRLEADIQGFVETSVSGNILAQHSAGGESYMLAGSLAEDGSFWTLVLLSRPFRFTTAIWLVLAILALSLMCVSGLIAVRYLGTGAQEERDLSDAPDRAFELESENTQLDAEAGGDGYVEPVNAAQFLVSRVGEPNYSSLHEAILRATDDYVIVLDRKRNVVYSNPVLDRQLLQVPSTRDGLTAYADVYLDEKARSRFDNWLDEGPESRPLTMDVRDEDGLMHPSRWYARNIETRSGKNFEVFIGRRLLVEEFPIGVN